ncbi:MAG TPA: hypothetical protein VKW78_07250 [Terriglobales bacterium]|nr:hypothetical protein [Terriglobales bacterium]
MNCALFYRIAAGLLIFFALAHTAGLLSSKAPSTEAALVRHAMKDVQFHNMGTTNTFYGYYLGFGLSLSAYLLFAAFVSLHLGALAKRNPSTIGGLGCALLAVQISIFVICCIDFFAAPIVVSGLVVVCLGLAVFRPARAQD